MFDDKEIVLVKHKDCLDTYYTYDVSLWSFIISQNISTNNWDVFVINMKNQEWEYSKSTLEKVKISIKTWLNVNTEENFKKCMNFT